MSTHHGTCACGDVRVSIAFDPLLEFQCHCSVCKLHHGTSLSALAFGEDEITIDGKIEIYSWTGGSGEIISKHYCPTCGVPIFIKPEVLGGMVYVPAGLLTPDYDFKPKVELWNDGRPQWMSQAPTIVESFPDNGTIERIQLILGNLDQRA